MDMFYFNKEQAYSNYFMTLPRELFPHVIDIADVNIELRESELTAARNWIIENRIICHFFSNHFYFMNEEDRNLFLLKFK